MSLNFKNSCPMSPSPENVHVAVLISGVKGHKVKGLVIRIHDLTLQESKVSIGTQCLSIQVRQSDRFKWSLWGERFVTAMMGPLMGGSQCRKFFCFFLPATVQLYIAGLPCMYWGSQGQGAFL